MDYETKDTYDLTLGVTDNVDHESNDDDSLDDTLAVRIEVTDVAGYAASLSVSNESPTVGDPIEFTIIVEDPPAPAAEFHFAWSEQDQGGGHSATQAGDGGIPQTFHPLITPGEAVVREYYITLWVVDDQNQIHDQVPVSYTHLTLPTKRIV